MTDRPPRRDDVMTPKKTATHSRLVRPYSSTPPGQLKELDPDDVLERLHIEMRGVHTALDTIEKVLERTRIEDDELHLGVAGTSAVVVEIVERLQRVEEKADALITDSRRIGRDLAAKGDGIRRELRVAQHKLNAIGALAAKAATANQLDEVKLVVAQLETLIGQPPQKLSERASQQHEHTAEELAALEQGTGLAGVVGRLVAGQARLNRRVAIGAIAGSASVPVLLELFKIIFRG